MADTVPAMLEPGEYVLNRNAVKAIGKNKLDELNFDMAPRDLLSRTDKGNYVIPAGKNIFGQPTKEMGMDELMEMILPVGSIGKMSKTVRELGKKGIDEYMIKPTRHEGIKKMGKLVTTGKGKKEVLDNARLETLLMEVKKWARSRGVFEDVIKKQSGGEFTETLLSILSGGKYETSKDLPSIREQAIPALEFMTGAEHVPEGEEASLLNLALAIPFLGKGAKSVKAAKPALSKYYAGLFGGKKPNEKKVTKYLERMFSEKADKHGKIYIDSDSPPFGKKHVLAPKNVLAGQSPSLKSIQRGLTRRGRDYKGEKEFFETTPDQWERRSMYGADSIRGLMSQDASKVSRGIKSFIKEARDAHKYYYGKQHGGIIEDHSLMGYMMPTLDKRLGKPLMKFEHGGTVPAPGQPGYYHYLEERGQAGQTQSPAPGTSPTPTTSTWTESTSPLRTMAGRQGAQNQLAQSSLSTSTSILDIFKDAGFELPEGDYLSGIEAYDPTKQKRLQQDLGMKMPALGGTGGVGFAGPTGAQTAQAEKERDELTQTYQRGAQDYRQKYREDILAQIAEDMQSGTYKFEERKDDPFMG